MKRKAYNKRFKKNNDFNINPILIILYGYMALRLLDII